MINRELPPPATKSIDEIHYVPDKYMFLFLQRTLPEGSLIAYEKALVIWDRPRRKTKVTKPDFYTLTPDGRETLIESTTSRRRKGKQDPKKWAKRIVRNGVPGRRLYVYYRDNLEAIQRHHPDLEFFKEDGKVNTSGTIFDARYKV